MMFIFFESLEPRWSKLYLRGLFWLAYTTKNQWKVGNTNSKTNDTAPTNGTRVFASLTQNVLFFVMKNETKSLNLVSTEEIVPTVLFPETIRNSTACCLAQTFFKHDITAYCYFFVYKDTFQLHGMHLLKTFLDDKNQLG